MAFDISVKASLSLVSFGWKTFFGFGGSARTRSRPVDSGAAEVESRDVNKC